MPESEIENRGGALRYRTLKLPSGRYMHVAVTPEAGPRGGHTVAGPVHEKTELAEGGVTMTRQNYELLARVLRDNSWGLMRADRQRIADSFADALAETNPNFDRERFLKAAED